MRKISHISHGLGDHATGHAGHNIATDGAPKKVTEIAFHSGMSRQQKAGAGLGGMGHGAVAGTAPAAPLQHTYGSGPNLKHGKLAPVHPSQSLGTGHDAALRDLGHAIMDAAFAAPRGKVFK
jgi:hypothetical protein